MAEIKLSDGALLKVTKSKAELRGENVLAHERFVEFQDTTDGKLWDVNPQQIVWIRDND